MTKRPQFLACTRGLVPRTNDANKEPAILQKGPLFPRFVLLFRQEPFAVSAESRNLSGDSSLLPEICTLNGQNPVKEAFWSSETRDTKLGCHDDEYLSNAIRMRIR